MWYDDHMQAQLTPLRVLVARPRGFCAGVVRAIDIVERALELFGTPVYVRHQIVHNRHVVERLEARGAIFVDALDQVPVGAVTIFSAHGVSPSVEAEASGRGLDVIDATCPLVRRVHKEGRRYREAGYDVVLVGHSGHAEVEGTKGQVPGILGIVATVEDVDRLEVRDPGRVAFITQTTLSVMDTRDVISALRRRFPDIVGPDTKDICYATQNRQKAVLELASRVELLLVVGSANSSNASRLQEIGAGLGIPSYLIDDASKIDPQWLDGVTHVGLTAGASTPEHLIQDTLRWLATMRSIDVEFGEDGDERVYFRVPERLAASTPPHPASQASLVRP